MRIERRPVWENWLANLKAVGIPVTEEVIGFNDQVQRTHHEQNFDMYEMSWAQTTVYSRSTDALLPHSTTFRFDWEALRWCWRFPREKTTDIEWLVRNNLLPVWNEGSISTKE